MGNPLRALVALTGAIVLALGGCASGASGPSGAAGSTSLVASGLELAGTPPTSQGLAYPQSTWWQMVADGAGQVWFLGLWQLIRLDPGTGQATTWDAADDARFASTGVSLAPAAGSGVWLLDGDRVRLFDGDRFAVDLQVPGTVLDVPGGPEATGHVHDVVEVGPDLWVSVVDSAETEDAQGTTTLSPGSGGQVARFADGAWKVMSKPEDGIGGFLTVDTDAAVWSGGVILPSSSGNRAVGGVRRWDGRSWTRPDADSPRAPTSAGDVQADPNGGVYFVSWSDGLRRFDGTAWTVAEQLTATFQDSWTPRGAGLAVSSSGDAWAAGGDGVARVTADGRVELFDRNQGASGLLGLAVAGDQVVVLDSPDVLRLEGKRFRRIWQNPVRPSSWSGVHAVSADEVWVSTQDRWFRFRAGKWAEIAAAVTCYPPVVASDGAVWTGSPNGGLGRISDAGHRVVTDRPIDCGSTAGMHAGLRGSMWVMQGGDVVRYQPDGRHASIGRPKGMAQVCMQGVDPEGSVWVTRWVDVDEEECSDPASWTRWDGRRWIPEQGPSQFISAGQRVVVGEGVGWVVRASGTGSQIARYADGRLTPVATIAELSRLTAVDAGRACGFAGEVIVCFDAGGEIARFDVAGMGVSGFNGGFSVAPDGTVWVLGPQVARLTQKLPTH